MLANQLQTATCRQTTLLKELHAAVEFSVILTSSVIYGAFFYCLTF
jgi:hypothetical protein